MLQFLNIKAWLLALTLVAGWIAGQPDALQRFAIVAPVMLVYAFASNFAYALAGALLRNWLAPGQAPAVVQPRDGRGAGAHRLVDGQRMKIKDETLGMWLGVLGVAFFAVTLPMTRLATGTQAAPQLSPWFVTLGRAALAGVLSAIFLLATRSPVPQRHQWKPLGMAVLGNVIGYPLLLAYALRVVSASHAAVITALLPLVTAACAAWVLHQRARLGFWLCALAGSAAGGRVLRAARGRPRRAASASTGPTCCWSARSLPLRSATSTARRSRRRWARSA